MARRLASCWERATSGYTYSSMDRSSVLIVGGGLAGLAAASELATAGCRVTLVESRAKLGGRASSFVDPSTGEVVDNCQHVSMGCCTNLAHFCRRVGVGDLFQDHPRLYFQDEAGRVSVIRSSCLPAPFHLVPSFLRASFLTFGEKLRVAWAMAALMRRPRISTDLSFLDWLQAHKQTARTIERFWALVLVSALNETLDRVDYAHAHKVFVEGFLWNRQAFRVSIPSVPLGDLYGAKLEEWLGRNGVEVRKGATAKEVILDGDRVVGCRLRDASILRADATVLCVPFHRLLDLLPARARELDSRLDLVGRMESSPITSVHFWFDRPVMDRPHVVALGRHVQWLFRRPTGEGGYVQGVISASRDLAARGNEEIERLVLEDVRAMLPAAREAKLLHGRVVTERRATYSVTPGMEELRPTAQTKAPGLWLAGDYVQTGWPATMEGAVRSGYLAAEGILAAWGKPARLVQPPPRRGILARALLRS